MRPFPSFLGAISLLIGGVLTHSAAETYTLPSPPRRPTIVCANFHGNAYPVVAIKNEEPVVEVDGKRQTAEAGSFSLKIGKSYAPGLVTVSEAELTRWLPSDTARGYSSFKAKIATQAPLPDVFLVVVAFDYSVYKDAQGSGRPLKPTIWATELGDLVPGKSKSVKAKFGLVAPRAQSVCLWSAVVFSGGKQVQTAGIDDPLPLFFDSIERYRYYVTRRERDKLPEAPFALFRALPIDLPGELKSKYGGKEIQVLMEVGRDGKISAFKIEQLNDPLLLEFVESFISRWWLFLPPRRNGEDCSQNLALKVSL